MTAPSQLTAGDSIEPGDWSVLGSVFSFAWAFQALEEKSDRLDLGALTSLDGITDCMVIAAALALLLRSQSLKLLCTLSAASLANVAVELPHIMNHIVIASCLNTLLLFRLGSAWLRGDLTPEREAKSRQRLFREIAPTAQILLAMLYGFAFFHKLNWDFIDLQQSCVRFSYQQTQMILPFLPRLNATLVGLGIGLTYVIELGIPILLLVPRTRGLGLVVGCLFHLGLGVHVPSFTILLFCFYIFFVPPALWRPMGGRLAMLPGIGALWRPITVTAALTLLASWYGLFHLSPTPLVPLMRWSWLAATSVLLVAVAWLYWHEFRVDMGHILPRVGGALPLLLFALVGLNGMGPYLGFKTEGTFSMYSNLRTAGVSNHMLIPKGALQLTDMVDDLIEIDQTDHRALSHMQSRQLITRFELRRLLQKERERNATVQLSGIRAGRPFSSTEIQRDPFFAEPISLPLRKLAFFRPVLKDGSGQCAW